MTTVLEFDSCLGCGEPGAQALTRGGTYTLTVGNQKDPSSGTYRLQTYNIPPPDRFSIKIGDKIKPGIPGAGAGAIEVPGAEDVYVFSATAGQKISFHLSERGKGMDSSNGAVTTMTSAFDAAWLAANRRQTLTRSAPIL
jgi:hypothetical protein